MAKIDYIPIGGAIGGAIAGAELAMIRLYYILDCETGVVKILSKKYLTTLLEDYADLKFQFESEKETKNQEVLLKYINKINEKSLIVKEKLHDKNDIIETAW